MISTKATAERPMVKYHDNVAADAWALIITCNIAADATPHPIEKRPVISQSFLITVLAEGSIQLANIRRLFLGASRLIVSGSTSLLVDGDVSAGRIRSNSNGSARLRPSTQSVAGDNSLLFLGR